MTVAVDQPTQLAVLGAMSSVVAEPRSNLALGCEFIAATAALLFDNPIADDAAPVTPVAPDGLTRLVAGRPDVADVAAELIALASVVDGALDSDRLEVALDFAERLGVKTT
jgi:hypothetical protein